MTRRLAYCVWFTALGVFNYTYLRDALVDGAWNWAVVEAVIVAMCICFAVSDYRALRRTLVKVDELTSRYKLRLDA